MDEARLIEKLAAIEALFSGATTVGERVAADRARQRIAERLGSIAAEDPPIEYRFTLPDMWRRKVLVALLRRYGFKPYRYARQRYTTVMARVSNRFVDETLWPEYLELSETLAGYLAEVTDRIVAQTVHADTSDAQVVPKPRQLGAGQPERAPDPEAAATPPASTVATTEAATANTNAGSAPAKTNDTRSEPAAGCAPAASPGIRPEKKPGRNQPCWCGSGKKYKKCHEAVDRKAASSRLH